MVDSYHDRRTAYEFAVNPAGVKQDRYWFNDTNSDTSWDAVWDVAVARRRRAGAPSSGFRSRSCGSIRPRAGRSASRSSATVAHANETSTWPLLARSASGYVSSFGELTGLTFAERAEAARARALCRGPGEDGAGRMPPIRSSASPDPDAAVGLDLKYKRRAGTHAHRHGQSGLRPGRGRSGGREPRRVRDVLRGAAAVLRRRIRQLLVRSRLQRRPVHGPVLFAPHRPRAAPRS